MDSSLILAIDLGKCNSVFCGFDTATGEMEFRTAKTSPAIPNRAFRLLKTTEIALFSSKKLQLTQLKLDHLH